MIHPTHPMGPWTPHPKDAGRETRACTECGAVEMRGRCIDVEVTLERACGAPLPAGDRCGFIGPDWGQPGGPRFHRVQQANRAVVPVEYEEMGSGSRVRVKRMVGEERV